MRIVIDSNRVLAAMIKNSTTRGILFDIFFDFVAPDFILTEIHKYEDRVLKVAEITKNEFEILLTLIFECITIIPEIHYREFVELVKDEIKDPKDIAYMATCLASNAHGIWIHDPGFGKQNKVKIFTNIDMLRVSGKAKSD